MNPDEPSANDAEDLSDDVNELIERATHVASVLSRQGNWYLAAWVQQLYVIITAGVTIAFAATLVEWQARIHHRTLMAHPLSSSSTIGLYAIVATVTLALQVAVRTQAPEEPLAGTLARGRILSWLAIGVGTSAVLLGAQSVELPTPGNWTLEKNLAPVLASLLLAAVAADAVNVPMLHLGDYFRAAREKRFHDAYLARRAAPAPWPGFKVATAIGFGGWLAAASGIAAVPHLFTAGGSIYIWYLIGGTFVVYSTIRLIRVNQVARRRSGWWIAVPGFTVVVMYAMFGALEVWLTRQDDASRTLIIESALFVLGLMVAASGFAVIAADRVLRARHVEALKLFKSLEAPRKRAHLDELYERLRDDESAAS